MKTPVSFHALVEEELGIGRMTDADEIRSIPVEKIERVVARIEALRAGKEKGPA